MANQGRVHEGRALIQAIPEAEPRDALLKISAETQLLRDANQLDNALQLLEQANQRFPDDGDLLYDQAMVADSLKRYDDSERLLRRVMALQPTQANAFNALGYSLAERGQRLDEARQLISQALTLRPNDPFITDSLGWVEFRAGKLPEAVKLLRQAYAGRADPEIAAHLGEVLWVMGNKDEALRIWREGVAKDPANVTLKDTIKRLRAAL
jgi:Flp pilus assembly protein TadD